MRARVAHCGCMQWEDANTVLAIEFANILSVSTRTNYLMAMKELEIKVKPGKEAQMFAVYAHHDV